MRKLASVFLALSTIPLAIWSCGGDSVTDVPADAAVPDASDARADSPITPPVDASTRHCTLDNGSDPVALCIQKVILKNERRAAFVKALGVAASWDSKTFVPDTNGGMPLHDVHDDVAFAASISSYDLAARLYGDTEINADLDNVLVTMVTNIEMQLATPPAEYGGDVYLQLRKIAGNLRYINENDHAKKIDAIAEPYGRAIYTTYSQAVGAGDSVLGTPAGGGQVAYTTADVATGAVALLDMAVRHAIDDAANATLWVDGAKRALDHLSSRARDPVTHLYYRSLVTSGDPNHDALAGAMPNDALLSDVQATVMLALMRANELVLANPTVLGAFTGYGLASNADQLFRAMNTAGLWDSADRGYLEGYVPSTSTFLTNKPTRANALMFGAIHRKFIDAPPFDAGSATIDVVQLKALRSLFIQQQPDNSSLLSVVFDQTSYFRASSRDYRLAQLPPSDGGTSDAGTEPRAASYTAAATAAALEGLSEQLYGATH